MFQTPILLITFSRPEHTRQVFKAIKKQQPTKLFVFQDGPRSGNEAEIEDCNAVRAIFEEPLDWECELHTYYSDKNLGCGHGPATAISWFFSQVEEGLIFEDDCLPHPDFFPYCEELLAKYRNNEKVSLIAGSSFQDQTINYKESYYFGCGSYGTWGWATWKRAWLKFDYYLESIDKKSVKKIITTYFKESRQRAFWKEVYSILKKDRYNESCWDYQFYFSCWKDDMYAIIPNVNQITNIGFDETATHTYSPDHPAANLLSKSILPLRHPIEVKLNHKADFYVHRHYTRNFDYGWEGVRQILLKVNRWVKKMIGHQGSWIKNNKSNVVL